MVQIGPKFWLHVSENKTRLPEIEKPWSPDPERVRFFPIPEPATLTVTGSSAAAIVKPVTHLECLTLTYEFSLKARAMDLHAVKLCESHAGILAEHLADRAGQVHTAVSCTA